MTDQLTYKCPHCQNSIPLAASLMGKQVDCPECSKQFQAEAPVALVQQGDSPSPTSSVVEKATDDERDLRVVHPVIYRNHLLLTLLWLSCLIGGSAAVLSWLIEKPLLGLSDLPLLITGGVMLGIALIYSAFRWIQRRTVTMLVTTARTIVRRGLVAQSTNEVQHDDIRNIKSDRNMLERMFNYGDVALSSSGQDNMEIVVHDIPDPQGIIDIIRRQQ